MDTPIFFDSGDIKIQGQFGFQSSEKGVVITHPHPLYGGDMNNSVVTALTDAFWEKGYTTLRFNFRGVGKSHGCFDHGKGEQEDVLSALRYISEKVSGVIILAGYSFGAFVNAQAIKKEGLISQMIMVAPPVAFMDFGPISFIPGLSLVVTGSRDEIAPSEAILPLLSTWNPGARLEVIEGADHFYFGYTDRLKSIISLNLE